MERFHTASREEIIAGKVTDAYFARTMKILEVKNLSKPVVMEVRAASLPSQWPWAVFAGLEEALYFLEDIKKPIDFYAINEGTVFRPGDPVGYIMGDYKDICVYETALLGYLCQATGIATRAARCVIAAEGRPVLSFGARRLHPSMSILVDRNAYLGGCKGYSTIITAEKYGAIAAGTMPHALIMLTGDTVTATEYFDEIIEPEIPRVSLIDTFLDEKFEALNVAKALGEKLYGMRLDTPASRRGDFVSLLKEVRWELDLHGYKRVRLIASGGLDENQIPKLNPCCDGYGVGTSISNAPVVDFALDIVEIDGFPLAKRGKCSGRKRLVDTGLTPLDREIIPWATKDPIEKQDIITEKIKEGQLICALPGLDDLHKVVYKQLASLTLDGTR